MWPFRMSSTGTTSGVPPLSTYSSVSRVSPAMLAGVTQYVPAALICSVIVVFTTSDTGHAVPDPVTFADPVVTVDCAHACRPLGMERIVRLE